MITALRIFGTRALLPWPGSIHLVLGSQTRKIWGPAVHAILHHCHCLGFPPERARLHLHSAEENEGAEPLRGSGGTVTDWGY